MSEFRAGTNLCGTYKPGEIVQEGPYTYRYVKVVGGKGSIAYWRTKDGKHEDGYKVDLGDVGDDEIRKIAGILVEPWDGVTPVVPICTSHVLVPVEEK